MEQRADVVFVVDASDSMKPCFEQLKRGIKKFVKPFSQAGYESLRLGLLAYNAGASNGKWVYRHAFLKDDAPERMQELYSDKDSDDPVKAAFFTKSEDGNVDTQAFCAALDRIECCADENTPLALDCAADFPFEPLCTTRRVIVLFTDEKLEDGVLKKEALGDDCCLIDKVMNKVMTRHITLYYFGPECEGTGVIGEFPRVSVSSVKDYKSRTENEDVWSEIDFEKVLEGIGKSVTTSVLQIVDEDELEKAVYGQDQWPAEAWGKAEDGGVINITHETEGVELDTSKPIKWVNAKLAWKTAVDLDIHAFYKLAGSRPAKAPEKKEGDVTASDIASGFLRFIYGAAPKSGNGGRERHIYFGNKKDEFMALDVDAGIGGKLDHPDGNCENIKCSTLKGIERILFATKIYQERGCFSDYKGRVEITTSNNSTPLSVDMVSRERKNWCVIAMIDNSDPKHPKVYPVNEVVSDEPDVNDPRWIREKAERK